MAAAAQREIEARNKEFCASFNRKDYVTCNTFYTENAVCYQHNEKPIKGRKAMASYMDKFTAAVSKLEFESIEHFELFNDTTAYILYIAKCSNSAGQVLTKFKGGAVWRKTGGQWFLDHDVYNDMPL